MCQLRWPELTQLVQQFEPIAQAIGADIANDYPLFTVRHESNFVVGPSGVSSSPGVAVYQWTTPDGRFNVHFSHTFLTVETQRYTSKEDLIGRLEKVLEVVVRHAAIPICVRMGYRYTNRVPGDIDIRPLIRAEVRGGDAVAPPRPGVRVVQSVSETLFKVDADTLLARWAQLPGGVTIDPTLPPLSTESWLLDLDAYNEETVPFVAADIARSAFRLAGRGYTFFRWSVTDKFLEVFGGK
jgi:uncharacterized protein (TIGR04255 family)